MKQTLLVLISVLTSISAFSQSFFVPTTFRGAFAPAPTAMWTDGWCNWDPQNAIYPTATVNVTTAITTNTTWTTGNTYLLQGQIYVKNGATLTIQPGVTVLGDKATAGSGLFITQGSKLNAVGTAANPIVFTSNQVPGARALGDWGGIILMGRGAINQAGGVAYIEGLAPTPDTQFGGGLSPDNTDDSGTLSYVRIEFSGYIYQPNKEINGLTMGGVGTGTQLDHIQVSYGNDDAFEWFGGAVSARYLVSYRNLDDDFDTDFGWAGNVQFGLIVRDPNVADNPTVSTSEGFESDNDATGSSTTPITQGAFSNITAIGPLRGNISATVNTGYRRGLRLRRNTQLKIFNSLFLDFKTGIFVDNANPGAEANATNDLLKFKNNIIAGTQTGKVTERIASSTFPIQAWFGANANDSLAATTGILVTPYDYLAPDYRPTGGSPALSNVSFSDAFLAANTLTAPTVATTTFDYCVGETASALSATATNGNTLLWFTAPTGGVGSTTVPTASTTVAGTQNYYVAQTNGEGFESSRVLIEVNVNALPAVPAITPNGATTFCTGGSVDLTADAATSYLWTPGNQTTQTITVSTSGTYSVTVENAAGCQATSATVNVNVSNAPTPTIQASSATSVCDGECVTLSASTSDSYTWSNGETTQSIVVCTSGTFTCVTTNANACDGVGTSNAIAITVTPQPVITTVGYSTSGTVVNFTSTSTGGTTYSWDFGDLSNSSAQNPAHAYVGNDLYTVTFTAINGNCQADTTFSVLINVGLNEVKDLFELNIYPNPSNSGLFNLIFNENQANENFEAVLVDANGRMVYRKENINGSETTEIGSVELNTGIYFLQISGAKETKVLKLQIVK
jgi:Secretion system C-terminal sorting domain/PKD domain/Ig-like domain CHU_C associated